MTREEQDRRVLGVLVGGPRSVYELCLAVGVAAYALSDSLIRLQNERLVRKTYGPMKYELTDEGRGAVTS